MFHHILHSYSQELDMPPRTSTRKVAKVEEEEPKEEVRTHLFPSGYTAECTLDTEQEERYHTT